jgi:hypothetical protein
MRAARVDLERAERNLKDAQRTLQEAERVRGICEGLLRSAKDLPSVDVQLSPRLPRR